MYPYYAGLWERKEKLVGVAFIVDEEQMKGIIIAFVRKVTISKLMRRIIITVMKIMGIPRIPIMGIPREFPGNSWDFTELSWEFQGTSWVFSGNPRISEIPRKPHEILSTSSFSFPVPSFFFDHRNPTKIRSKA